LLHRARTVALDLAREAGALLRERVGGQRNIEHKGTIDIVTDADRASETLIVAGLRQAFPEFRLIGEEGSHTSAEDAEETDYGWVIDPLDGTTNFAHAYPHFAVSIGLEHHREPVMGVVYDPMRDEAFVAVQGDGATLNGDPLRVSTTDALITSLLATGFPYDLSRREESNALWTAFNSQTQGVRRDGSAALNLCYVAAGRLDGFYERPVNSWDIGAGAIIVREAGGVVTALEGGPFAMYDGEVLASNPHIQELMLDVIGQTLVAVPVRT
jgi:myo-inositol-1(or 4)-monophosphatase